MKKRALAVMLAGVMVFRRTDRCVGCIRYFRSKRRRTDTFDDKYLD